MLAIAGSEPLPFERIVEEEVTAPLAAHGFRREPASPSDKDNLVSYLRKRGAQEERVQFGRRIYSEEEARSGSGDAVDETAGSAEGESWWASRHLLYVQILVDFGHSVLLSSGEIGEDTGEEWWYFKDEGDLRRQLRLIVPLLSDKATRKFNEALEAGPERKRMLQENVA
ncbi:MAG TPA: hypothetical protein VFS10_09825 [Pyrinomonadaceae bacterium]|nr:hypothetical protein [Pyrinomonadaceae bacterium]